MGVGERLFRIIRAAIESAKDDYKGRLFSDSNTGDERGRQADYDFYENSRHGFENREKSRGYNWDPEHSPAADLEIFNLSDGASWDEVKRGYRAECKKYHSDLYHNDPGKKEAAEEIMVIYNTAYARLKRHYQKK